MMRRKKPKKRYLTIVLIVLAWLPLGLALPLIFDGQRVDFNFDVSGVIAAPRDSFQVTSPQELHSFTRTTLKSGAIAQLSPTGARLSGTRAQEMLKSGEANLAFEGIDMSIGEPPAEGLMAPSAGASQPPAPVIAALTTLKFASVTLRNSRIGLRLPSGRTERLFNVNMKATRRGRTGISAKGTAVWRGQDVKLEIATSGVSRSGAAMPFNASLESALLTIRFAGKIVSKRYLQLEGDVAVAVPNLRSIARALGGSWPDGAGLKDVMISGPLKWTEASAAFAKAKVKLDGNEGSGALSIKTAKTLPQVSGTLAFDELNITPYLQPAATNSKKRVPDLWEMISGTWSMPLARYFGADARLSAKEVVVGDVRLGKAAATVSLKDAKLSAQLASLAFEGGSGSGQLTMDFNDIVPLTTVHGKLVNVPLGDLASALFGARSIEGRATITADLAANGNHLKPMIESLSGNVKLDVTEGGAIGFDLAALMKGGNVSGKSNFAQLIRDAAQGTTRLDGLDLDLKFNSGSAVCQRLEAKFGDQVAKVAGQIDLMTKHVDLKAIVHADVDTVKTAAQEPEKPVTGRVIMLYGDWYEPRVTLREMTGRPTVLAAELLGDGSDRQKAQ